MYFDFLNNNGRIIIFKNQIYTRVGN